MAVARDFPYNNAQYRVDIPDLGEFQGFDEVILPELLIEVDEMREGNGPARFPRKLPGLSKYTNLYLRRGYTGRLDLYQWWKAVADGEPSARRTISIHLLDDNRNQVTSWRLFNAFPVRYAISPLVGLDGSLLLETLEVSCDTVEME